MISEERVELFTEGHLVFRIVRLYFRRRGNCGRIFSLCRVSGKGTASGEFQKHTEHIHGLRRRGGGACRRNRRWVRGCNGGRTASGENQNSLGTSG
jgi:hypothetical protein